MSHTHPSELVRDGEVLVELVETLVDVAGLSHDAVVIQPVEERHREHGTRDRVNGY